MTYAFRFGDWTSLAHHLRIWRLMPRVGLGDGWTNPFFQKSSSKWVNIFPEFWAEDVKKHLWKHHTVQWKIALFITLFVKETAVYTHRTHVWYIYLLRPSKFKGVKFQPPGLFLVIKGLKFQTLGGFRYTFTIKINLSCGYKIYKMYKYKIVPWIRHGIS